ncbi:MAG: IclR family transcriptional regulator [Gordonia amarae]
MDTPQPKREGAQSVLRALTILEAVAKEQPAGLSKLARTVNLPKTTVYRLLRTLAEAGWIAPQGDPGDQKWHLTARALAVGSSAVSQVDLRQIARPVMESLGEQTGENIHLSAPDGAFLVLVDKVPSTNPVQTVAHIGARTPIHTTGSGWAFLARLSADEVEDLLPAELVATSAYTVTDRGQLEAGIRATTEAGYAVNHGMWRDETASVAAAIVDKSGHPIGSLSVSMPSYRLTADRESPFGEMTRDAAAEISRRIAALS